MKHATATITFEFEYDEEQFEDGSVYVNDVFFENPAEFDWRLTVDEELPDEDQAEIQQIVDYVRNGGEAPA